jgi:hypothetical protein
MSALELEMQRILTTIHKICNTSTGARTYKHFASDFNRIKSLCEPFIKVD